MLFLAGILKLIGFTGGILGVIDLIRKRPAPPRTEAVNVELADRHAREQPLALEQCPTCHTMVTRGSDGMCPVCRGKTPA